MAQHRPCSLAVIREQLGRLSAVVDQPGPVVLTALKAMIPEFRPPLAEAPSAADTGDDSDDVRPNSTHPRAGAASTARF